MRNPAGRRADNDHRETITSGRHRYINQKYPLYPVNPVHPGK